MKYEITNGKIRKIIKRANTAGNKIENISTKNKHLFKTIDNANTTITTLKTGYNYTSDWETCQSNQHEDNFHLVYVWDPIVIKLHQNWIPFINWNITHKGEDIIDSIRSKISLVHCFQIQDLLEGGNPNYENIKKVIMTFGFLAPSLKILKPSSPIPQLQVKLFISILNPADNV